MRQSTMGCAGPGSISWDNSVLSTITWLPAWALKHGTCVALVRSASLILSAKAPSDQSGVCGRSCKLFACIFQQHPTTSKLPECSFGFASHHCVKSGSLLPEMVAGWNRFFHNIPSVQDSQGPREEAKSYRPAIPSSLACRPLVQGHNYFIFSYTALTPTNGAHLISSYNDSCKHCPWIQLFVAFTFAMVLLANISRMLKQLPLTARTWGHFKLPKINHDDDKNALEGFLRTSTVSSTFRTLASGSGASTTMLFGNGTLAPEQEWRSATGYRVCENVKLTSPWNVETKKCDLKYLHTVKPFEKTLQVVDCEKHFALWTGMVWTRSSQDWI